jgi:hypothetical protein
MGMNLQDVVQVLPKEFTKSVKLAEFEEYKNSSLDAFNNIKGLQGVTDLATTKKEIKVLDDLKKKSRENFHKQRLNFLGEFGTLPNELVFKKGNEVGYENNQLINKLIDTPIISVAKLKEIANKLSFVIIPFEYLDSNSYGNESYDMCESIKGFNEELSGHFDVYTICPPVYYSVKNHVKSTEDKAFYVGSNISQAFMAISMVIPMFRSLFKSIENLEENSKLINQRLSTAEQEIDGIKIRIQQLQDQIEQEARDRILNQKRQEEQESLKRQQELIAMHKESLIVKDPMMLALSKSKNINSDIAFVGPCWGPDFKDIVMTGLGLNRIDNQREMLVKSAEDWRRIEVKSCEVNYDDPEVAWLRNVNDSSSKKWYI